MDVKLKTDNRNPAPAEPSREHIAPALLALASGIVAGDNVLSVAEMIPCSVASCQPWKVIERASIFMLLSVYLLVVVAGYFSLRGKIGYGPVLVAVLAAVVSALFSFLNYTINAPIAANNGNAILDVWEALYHWIWLVLLLMPAIPFLLSREPFLERRRNAVRFITATFAVALSCAALGFLVKLAVGYGLKLFDVECEVFLDKDRFWLAHPPAINLVCGALFLIVFSPFWWKEYWEESHIIKKGGWVTVTSVVAIVHAGAYGPTVYTKRMWAADSIRVGLADEWQFSLAFGALPAVMIVSVFLSMFLSWRLTRKGNPRVTRGWQISSWFWLFLPLVLASGFAAVAGLGFVDLAERSESGITSTGIYILIVAHAANGALLALSFWLLFRFLPQRLLPVNVARTPRANISCT